MIVLYGEPDFGGRPVLVREDLADLSSVNFDNKASSFKIYGRSSGEFGATPYSIQNNIKIESIAAAYTHTQTSFGYLPSGLFRIAVIGGQTNVL